MGEGEGELENWVGWWRGGLNTFLRKKFVIAV